MCVVCGEWDSLNPVIPGMVPPEIESGVSVWDVHSTVLWGRMMKMTIDPHNSGVLMG